MGQDVVDLGGRVRAYSTKDIGEIGKWILVVGHAGGDEGIETGEVLAGLLVPDK